MEEDTLFRAIFFFFFFLSQSTDPPPAPGPRPLPSRQQEGRGGGEHRAGGRAVGKTRASANPGLPPLPPASAPRRAGAPAAGRSPLFLASFSSVARGKAWEGGTEGGRSWWSWLPPPLPFSPPSPPPAFPTRFRPARRLRRPARPRSEAPDGGPPSRAPGRTFAALTRRPTRGRPSRERPRFSLWEKRSGSAVRGGRRGRGPSSRGECRSWQGGNQTSKVNTCHNEIIMKIYYAKDRERRLHGLRTHPVGTVLYCTLCCTCTVHTECTVHGHRSAYRYMCCTVPTAPFPVLWSQHLEPRLDGE